MIIDIHTHLGKQGNKVYRAGDLTRAMGKGGVTHALVFADYADDRSGMHVRAVLKEISGYKNLFAVACFWPKFSKKDYEELKMLFKNKTVRGFKIYLGYDKIYPNDKRLEPIYDLCEKYDLPVIFHTGLFYPHEGALLKFSHPLPIDELAVRRPKLKIVIAHSGYPWTREAAALVHKNDNVYADLAGFLEFESFTPFNRKHFTHLIMEMRGIAGSLNKFLFGTDYPLAAQAEYVRFIRKLPITRKEKEQIFFKNARKLFKI